MPNNKARLYFTLRWLDLHLRQCYICRSYVGHGQKDFRSSGVALMRRSYRNLQVGTHSRDRSLTHYSHHSSRFGLCSPSSVKSQAPQSIPENLLTMQIALNLLTFSSSLFGDCLWALSSYGNSSADRERRNGNNRAPSSRICNG